ncbi:MAG: cob(I)yrinic acid a,c-diamide adenosyltransferase [Proteobacteria bacterium]|nr:cob(I)yrinic acid a,c-diamide adenosyltransferase [Pseudomonadota bacterium]MBU1450481.1 cob(I)yrinic acid a,c-diamide adenosyltransferase [Pseudomonadota bacterium]MBU2469606.1 cob(I)yrinic acid a,c-diamide adenosyltransferase [Pseudomonadota bacterium]MBU2516677.1 cob(I)yrinic acid a,c-diamide adenosyltransferase [Pseudomonadota bacterium]
MAQRKGLVMINTGDGKGKTTAALGLTLRASGYGWNILIIQFIKSGQGYSEMETAGNLPGVEIRATGLGLILPGKDRAPHQEAARQGWEMAKAEVASGKWDLVVLDEINNAMAMGFLEAAEVAELIKNKPEQLHLVLTGRGCPKEIMELADMVTVMDPWRHHSDKGVPAQEGVEF